MQRPALGKSLKEIEEDTQPSFDFTAMPVTRSSDPITSFEAEDNINTSGTRKRDFNKTIAAMRKLKDMSDDGCTGREIAKVSGVDYVQTMRRLHDVVKAGLASRGAKRKCRTQSVDYNQNYLTWWLKS